MSVLLELVLQSTYAGQQCINRFNYLANGTPAETNAAAALVQGFGCIWDGTAYPSGLPFNDILLLQNTGVVYQFASARDVYDPLNFSEVPFVHPATGQAGSGDASPPFLAFGMRTNRIRTDISRGYKRFVGVGESDLTGDGILVSGAVARVQVVADALSAVLTQTLGGNDFTFAPVIVKKQRYNTTTHEADPDGTAYRYPLPEPEPLTDVLAAGIVWEGYAEIRSQVSRQYGHGR